MKRTTLALTLAAALSAPAAANAEDCGARINQVVSHPAVQIQTNVDDAPVVESGDAVKTEDGTVTFSETGPATPRDNWFGDKPQHAALIGYIETAMAHNADGDEPACNQAIGEAEELLKEHGSS